MTGERQQVLCHGQRNRRRVRRATAGPGDSDGIVARRRARIPSSAAGATATATDPGRHEGKERDSEQRAELAASRRNSDEEDSRQPRPARTEELAKSCRLSQRG